MDQSDFSTGGRPHAVLGVLGTWALYAAMDAYARLRRRSGRR